MSSAESPADGFRNSGASLGMGIDLPGRDGAGRAPAIILQDNESVALCRSCDVHRALRAWQISSGNHGKLRWLLDTASLRIYPE